MMKISEWMIKMARLLHTCSNSAVSFLTMSFLACGSRSLANYCHYFKFLNPARDFGGGADPLPVIVILA